MVAAKPTETTLRSELVTQALNLLEINANTLVRDKKDPRSVEIPTAT